jgi:hypothetical protein
MASHEGNSSETDIVDQRGTSYSSPVVAAVLAHFFSWEALRGPDSGEIARRRLLENGQPDLISWVVLKRIVNWVCLYGRPNLLANTGINHPRKDPDSPYFGAPNRPQRLCPRHHDPTLKWLTDRDFQIQGHNISWVVNEPPAVFAGEIWSDEKVYIHGFGRSVFEGNGWYEGEQ